MSKVWIYQCLYYNEGDYSKWYCPEIEVAVFNNENDAIEYQKDFESNINRLNNLRTYYEGYIKEDNIL